MRFVNTDTVARSWNDLVNLATGTTLDLGPGESADVGRWTETEHGPVVAEPDDDFSHPHLRRVIAPEPADIAEAPASEPSADDPSPRKRSKE